MADMLTEFSSGRSEGASVDRAPAPADTSLLRSATYLTFLKFMGDTPFTPNEQFWLMMKDLDAQGIRWESTLAEHANSRLWRERSLITGNTFLSMGPLEGSLELQLAAQGARRVVALEGQRANYLKCRVLNALFPSLPLEFREADAMRLDEVEPDFDVILCWGVLYHLREPHVWLQKAKALRPCLILAATQLAVDPPHPAFASMALGDIGQLELGGHVYRGRWYRELPGYRSALNSDASFWLYPNELRRLCKDLGLQLVEWMRIDLGQLGVTGVLVLAMPTRADWPPSIRSWVRRPGILGMLPRRARICRIEFSDLMKHARKTWRPIVRSAFERVWRSAPGRPH
jgi:hypothetical protein